MTEIDWSGLLAEQDVEGLWNGLFQLVSRHPAVRPLHFATDGAAVSSQTEINADLAQELFLELFQKQRFDHYVREHYRSIDIENELARIEVSAFVFTRFVNRENGGMPDVGVDAGGVEEFLGVFRIGAQTVAQDMQRDRTANRGLFRLVNFVPKTLRQFSSHAIGPKLLAR